MANTSQASLTLTLTGVLNLQQSFVVPPNVAAPNSMPEVTLASGDNQFAVPAGTQWLLVQPPPANTNTLKVRTLVGDTGITVSPTLPAFIPLGSTVTTVWINASAQTAGVQLVWG